MDPLSLSASMIAVLQATAAVIDYLSDVRDASKERARLLLELPGLQALLKSIEHRVAEAEADDEWFVLIRDIAIRNGPLDQMKDVMELLKRKLDIHQSGTLVRFGNRLKWHFEKDEFAQMLARFERLKSVFIAASSDQLVELAKILQEDMKQIQSSLSKIGQSQLKHTQAIHTLTNSFNSFQIDHERQKIQDWLKAPNPAQNYNAGLRKRQVGSGKWFIESQTFEEWRSKPGGLVCLYGKPGCGKSVLCSTIIQEVLQHSQLDNNSTVAYFYFDFNDHAKQSYEQLLCSLLVQLSSQHSTIPSVLLNLYAQSSSGLHRPLLNDLTKIFMNMVELPSNTYIVLDALDECGTRTEVLNWIADIRRVASDRLHVLLLSRKERDIEEALEVMNTRTICIEDQVVDADIKAYIQEQLEDDLHLRKWPVDIRHQIEETLMRKAHGMFRWVFCQLDSLRKCVLKRTLMQVLGSLPKTLDDTYTRILANIPSEYTEEAVQILQWLCFSVRPIRLGEIIEYLAIDNVEPYHFDSENRLRDPRDILSICSTLVTIVPGDEKEDNKHLLSPSLRQSDHLSNLEHHDMQEWLAACELRLAHYSVKEFLISERIRQTAITFSVIDGPSHARMAVDCLRYLMQFNDVERITLENMRDRPAAEYSARFWCEHARVADENGYFEIIWPVAMSLMMNYDIYVCAMKLLTIYGNDYSRDANKFIPEISIHYNNCAFVPLYQSSREGCLSLSKHLVSHGFDINASVDSMGLATALWIAARNGHESTVQYLLENGAKPNTQNGELATDGALETALYHHHEEIAMLLLDHGADVHSRDDMDSTPLLIAAYVGNAAVVQRLLQNGADVEAIDSWWDQDQTALMKSSTSGSYEIVQMLLEAGASANVQDAYGSTALMYAVGCWRTDRKDNDFHTRYIAYLRTVELLLQHGADVDLQCDSGNTVLTLATSKGFTEIVSLLLSRRPLLDLRNGRGYTALHMAAFLGHEGIMKQLVNAGADTSMMSNENLTALQFSTIPESLDGPGNITGSYDEAIICMLAAMQQYDSEWDVSVAKEDLRWVDEMHSSTTFQEVKKKWHAAAPGRRRISELLMENGAILNHEEKPPQDLIMQYWGQALAAEN